MLLTAAHPDPITNPHQTNARNLPPSKQHNTGAFTRASTTSLGSICFGSLIVAALEAMKVRDMRLIYSD